MGIPVINHGRIERLKVPAFAMNMNMVCIVFIIICFALLFKRYQDVNRSRQ